MDTIETGKTKKRNLNNWLTPRRLRTWREYLTGYLMIAPATLLIFIFGIFPVGFALFTSLHKWQLVQGPYRGLGNYLGAIGNITYVMLFALGIGSLIGSWLTLRRLMRDAGQRDDRPWVFALPGLGFAAATAVWFRWAFLELPEVLGIANKIRGVERTRELFIRLLDEAFHVEMVFAVWQLFIQILLASVILAVLTSLIWKNSYVLNYISGFTISWLGLIIGAGLLRFMFLEINAVYAAAIETGEDPGIWPQFLMITSGIIALIVGYRVWQSAQKQETMFGFVLRLLGGLVLAVGAVLLILEIPSIVAGGDEDMWQGLKVTVFFSLGTVPVQLTIALFLSVLLFQKLKGSEAYRIIFFLPYVTPAVASAAVFKQMFANRVAAPANVVLNWLGISSQAWVGEPEGIISLIGNGLGLDIPAWASGPSMALVVIIMLSIWTYVGYNTVIYLAGLGNIPAELTEAAEIDGASQWEVFWRVTFPLLSPTTYFLSLLAIIGTFKAFNTIWIMREGAALGTTDPFSVVIFSEFFERTRYGYASALAFVLFAIILSLTLMNNRIQGSRVFYG
ncbi:MAG TPA: sugar ABC transporter permease [Anaerolineales bacterium]|nr:sugar ABC transporter permease [Anaerolineales bacterium]